MAQRCDRECLRGVITQYLNAMVAHKPATLPLSDKMRFTENTETMKLGDGLFLELPASPVFWHSHCDEVKELPSGFRCTASNQTCAIQAMEHESLPLFGVQFHPELSNSEHPDGHQLLENFLKT